MSACHAKKRYPTEAIAARAASCAMMRKLDAPDFLRVYRCPTCRGYHLTSKPFDPERRKPSPQAGRPPAVDNKAAGQGVRP